MRDLPVPYDADLLERVISDHDVPRKRLAFAADVAECSLSHYFSGERTLPSRVLRAAFELTRDPRLLSLVAGNVPIIVLASIDPSPRGGPGDPVPATPSPPPGGPGPHTVTPVIIPQVADCLPATCQATERLAGATTYLARILADGVINAADLQFLRKYQQYVADVQIRLAILQAAADRKLQEIDRDNSTPV